MSAPQTDDECRARLVQMSVVDENGCWLWQGWKTPLGYGATYYKRKRWPAHRLSFALLKGPIPEGMDVCHSCDVRHCINPDHLWTGTASDNILDCARKGRHRNSRKTHCDHGHEYTEENTWIAANGKRHCRACQRIRQRLRAGWPEDVAQAMATVPSGIRPVNAHWRRRATSTSAAAHVQNP